jgi:2'-5' RNA ligase
VDDIVAHEVASTLERAKRNAFELHMHGVISFGGRKPRAVVAAVAPAQALLDVHAEHERLMQRIGLEPEGRKYIPHVTLARLRESSSRDVADYLAARGFFRTSPFRVSRFVLFSSRASTGGGPYVVEASYPLSA